MKKLILLFFFLKTFFAFGQSDSIVISGQVTDFEGNPKENVLIMLKGDNFSQFVDTVSSDKNGKYAMKVQQGTYPGLAAVNMNEYAKTHLEFWAYNVPAYKDLNLDIRYERLEVYGLHAFRVKGAYPGYTIYFRPMSLSRYASADMKAELLDIAPDREHLNVKVEINGKDVNVNLIQKIKEYAGEQMMIAYLIHTDTGASAPEGRDYDKIRVVAEDLETGDKGEAVYFVKK